MPKILSASVQNLVAQDLCVQFSTRIIQLFVVTVNESQPLQPSCKRSENKLENGFCAQHEQPNQK